MVNVVATGAELQSMIEGAVKRHNERVKEFNKLPKEVQAQFDTQLFDDMDLLVRYINALTATLSEAAGEAATPGGESFEF